MYRRYVAYHNPRESFRSECPTAGDLRSPLFTTSGTCWTLGAQIRSSLAPSPGLPRAKGLLCGPRPICQSTPVVKSDQERSLFAPTCRHPFCHTLYRTSATAFFLGIKCRPVIERVSIVQLLHTRQQYGFDKERWIQGQSSSQYICCPAMVNAGALPRCLLRNLLVPEQYQRES